MVAWDTVNRSAASSTLTRPLSVSSSRRAFQRAYRSTNASRVRRSCEVLCTIVRETRRDKRARCALVTTAAPLQLTFLTRAPRPGVGMADDVVIALDVGGTGIKCALVDATGRVRHTERHSTGRERGPDAVVATILDIAEGLAKTAE